MVIVEGKNYTAELIIGYLVNFTMKYLKSFQKTQ